MPDIQHWFGTDNLGRDVASLLSGAFHQLAGLRLALRRARRYRVSDGGSGACIHPLGWTSRVRLFDNRCYARHAAFTLLIPYLFYARRR